MSGVPRTGSTQQPPDPQADLTGFPRRAVARGTQWYREHGPHGPWYFASGPGGRFNLDVPHGTLYLANKPEAAARERIGPDHVQHGAIPHSIVKDRWISTLSLVETVSAAHVTHDAAPSFRVGPAGPRSWPRDHAPRPLRTLLDQMPGLVVIDPPAITDLEILAPPSEL